ncbi:MAG: MBL fold metallo-hydrolase [Eubacterium sp.]|nr:MBL fold metallo-hydrolase [Eubacterium sp.]
MNSNRGKELSQNGEIMRVTFIAHSGFLVETASAYFLFDYFKGEIPELDQKKPLVVFVSHSHRDHYNPVVFDLFETYPWVHYVLDKDCGIKWKLRECADQGTDLAAKLTRVRKNQTYELTIPDGGTLQITTLRSTDAGVAYLLDYGGLRIYHAGDLSHWIWKDKPEDYNRRMAERYLREMEKLKGITVDVAFVPLDPRLLQDTPVGLEVFLEHVQAGKVFPMHVWEKFSVIQRFVKEHPCYRDIVVCLSGNGESIDLGEMPG